MAFPFRALAGLSPFIGTSSFLFQGLATTGLFYPVRAGSRLAFRLFGCRDALLATLLWTTQSPEARRRPVLAGAAVDALDIVAVVWGLAGDDVEAVPALAFGAGAASVLALAALGWRGAGLGRCCESILGSLEVVLKVIAGKLKGKGRTGEEVARGWTGYNCWL